MSWVLVFWIITARGDVHKNVMHGYGSMATCVRDGRAWSKRFDLVKFECKPDVEFPAVLR